jgi:hypothetical protein
MLIDPKNEGEAQDAILVRYGFARIERATDRAGRRRCAGDGDSARLARASAQG